MKRVYFCVDIGGTKTAWAIYGEDGCELAYRRFPTQPGQGAEALVQRVHLDARESLADCKVLGACIASPGPLRAEEGVMVHVVTLGWRNVPITRLFAECFGFPFLLLNDCDAGALGVAAIPALAGARSVCYMSLSTGIGGGLVLDGRLYTGRGNAAEFGHLPVPGEGLVCGCGRRDCLELYASGSGLERRYQTATGVQLSCAEIETLAREGDALAGRLFSQAADALLFASDTLCTVLDPEHLVLGGSVCRAGELLLGRLRSRHAVRFAPDDGKQVLTGACQYVRWHGA